MGLVTVVILGFYGSSVKHVQKYSKAWVENIPGIKRTVLVPSQSSFSLLLLDYLDAKYVVKEIKDEENVVFHVLSNRGMFVYLQVVHMLPKSVTVLGTIFDSSKYIYYT